ncbi:hypothetical protein ACFE04_020703 [Oxalis oulophora]
MSRVSSTSYVNNQQALAEYHLPVKFTWTIEKFTCLTQAWLYSQKFSAGGHQWQLLLYPKGYKGNYNYLCMYLFADVSAPLPNGWSRHAKISLGLVNQVDQIHSKKDVEHTFNAEATNTGINFITLKELHHPKRGYIHNDTIVVVAEISVRKPRSVSASQEEKLDKDEARSTITKRGGKKIQSSGLIRIKVARDWDLGQQIGRDRYFDLVDHDKVSHFQVEEHTPFFIFKEEVAKEFGVPVQFQRFWFWVKRQNFTYRLNRPITPQEEVKSVTQLSELSYNKRNNEELNLFLEVELGTDLRPNPLPEIKTNEDILVFIKLYEPEIEKLRYVGRLFVKSSDLPLEILGKLNQMAGYDSSEKIELYEEVSYEPSVVCDHLDKWTSFRKAQIEDGDVIWFQKALPPERKKSCLYPDVPRFLEYVHQCQVSVSSSIPEKGPSSESRDEESMNKNKLDICFDEIFTSLLKKLEEDNASYSVKMSDFKDIATSNYVDVGIFTVPKSLKSYANDLLARHPDIGMGNSPLHYVNEMVFVVLCSALKSMNTICFTEITESVILKWRDAIRGALQFGFKVDFLKDDLKSVTETYLAKLALSAHESKEVQAIDDNITAMEKRLDTLKSRASVSSSIPEKGPSSEFHDEESMNKNKLDICFDEISTPLLKQLEEDNASYSVKMSNFKDIVTSNYVDVGIFTVPKSLKSYASDLLARNPDIGMGNSPLHYVNEMDHLKSVTETYLAKLALSSHESKEVQAIDDNITAMEKRLDTLKSRVAKINKMCTKLNKSCEKAEARQNIRLFLQLSLWCYAFLICLLILM